MKTLHNKMACTVGALFAAVGLLSSGAASALTCNLAETDPDAYLNGASDCGLGIGVNPDGTNVDLAVTQNTFDYFHVSKDENVAQDPSLALGTDFKIDFYGGTKEGNWGIDILDASFTLANTDFLITLKDGDIAGTTAKWVYFIVDEASSITSCGTYELCGTWGMYGNDGTNRKDISHMDLFVTVSNGGPPPIEIPEPGSLALLGLGFLGMWGVRRRQVA